ncbi:MAG TPA: TIGR03086 family metal-binding protein [Acidimicrobiales bacterium]|nr:TIGR03086 family metal-binding protein [Acidimicrobiales bacterium]
MLDLEPATRTLANIVAGVRDDQLTAATPCRDVTVGALLDHVDSFSTAFTAAATKTPLPGGGQGRAPDASRLGTDWRKRIPERLAALGEAWHDGAAWTGMTRAGGQDLPADLAGVIALDEVVVHGWDIAAATGQSYTCEPELLAAVEQFVAPTAAQNPDGTPGLFGPPVAVPVGSSLLDRVIGLTGRDPRWPSGANGG